MQKLKSDALVLLGMTVFTFGYLYLRMAPNGFEIPMPGGIFTVSRFQFSLVTLAYISFFGFLILAILRGFKSISTNIALVIGMLLMLLPFYGVTSMFHVEGNEDIDNELTRVLSTAVRGGWILIGIWVLLIFVVVARTVWVWKRKIDV